MEDTNQALVADRLDDQTVATSVAAAITAPRLSTYLDKSAGDLASALKLYRHNLRLSGAIYEVLAITEVSLRNAMDSQLRLWNSTQTNRSTGQHHSADWTLDPSPLMRRLAGADIRKAAYRAGIGRMSASPPSHDDIVAQLSFGTWRFLLPDGDQGKQYLWTASLRGAFPYLKNSDAGLISRVDGIHRLRNRVAHLEPVLGTALIRRQLRSIRFVLRSIQPDLTVWLDDTSRIGDVILTKRNGIPEATLTSS